MYSLTRIVFITIALFLQSCTHHKEISQVVVRNIDSGIMPGGVLLIEKDGKIFYRNEWGTENGNEKVERDSLYDVASLTKITTAISILILNDKKQLSVNDSISKFYPEFLEGDKKIITVKDLLMHRSGVMPVVQALEDESYSDFIKRTLSLGLQAKPRTETIYSDVGFIILGDIVSKVSGTSLSDFVQVNILKPLNMNQTSYLKALQEKDCVPTTRDIKCRPHDPKAFHQFPSSLGHAGIFSTIDDLGNLARFLLKGNPKILSEDSFRLLTRLSDGEVRSLGLDFKSPYARTPRGEYFKEGVSFGHTGFTGTTLWVDPSINAFYVFLSNRVYNGAEKTGKAFVEFRLDLSNEIGKKLMIGP